MYSSVGDLLTMQSWGSHPKRVPCEYIHKIHVTPYTKIPQSGIIKGRKGQEGVISHTMLTEMLKKNKLFNNLPLDKQDILARLAATFQEDFMYLYLSPEELEKETGIGNKGQWNDLLSLDITSQYIKAQMGQQIQISQRKAVQALQAEALKGNTQATKQINELAGVMNQADNNKVIVLHQIARPKTIRQEINQ